jgi:glycosyltransferase involved in cell wall biosynthesis
MVAGDDKRVLLAGSDAFVLPSQSENFGISVIEAAACGIPVIISDRVNLWRDFGDARAGLVAPPTVEAFTGCLRFVLDNSAEAAAMAGRGADLVRRRFAWEALGDQYERMYMEAAQGGAGDSS